MRQHIYVGINNFDLVTLNLEFDLVVQNFKLGKNFWTVSARVLIFQMNIPYDNIFPLILNILTFG